MPKRTTTFQTVVAFIRQHWATPDVTVTESKMVADSRPGVEDREVDIVVEGLLDGEPMVISMEVIEHKRPATVNWVGEMIEKHRHLPTNRLILVSSSGFSKNALAAIEAEGGRVQALRPVLEEEDGKPVVKHLYLDFIMLTPTICRLKVRRTTGEEIVVRALPDNTIHNNTGATLGNALELVWDVLRIPWLFQTLATDTHNHPERDEVKFFTAGLSLGAVDYNLKADDGELQHITHIEIVGALEFKQEELSLTHYKLGSRPYAVGEARVSGEKTVWVQTTHPEAQVTKTSWRPTSGQARRTPSPPSGYEPRFRDLQHLPNPQRVPSPLETTD